MSDWQQCYDKLTQYLCPPGDGVFTVHTAKEKKQAYQQQLFGVNPESVPKQWQQQLQQLPTITKPLLLGICSDTGGGILRGANWGPLFVREAIATKTNCDYFDIGDVRVIPHLLHDKYLNTETIAECRDALYGDTQSALSVSPLSITEDVVAELYATLPETKLFSIGGDHSVSYPIVKQYLLAKQQQGKNVALLHFDAHTDLLDKRLGIDICFGSWTYHILPYLPAPEHLIQVGIRSTGKAKDYWQQQFNIQQIWANEVEQQGATAIADAIIAQYQQLNVDELYISFDIDALDRQYAGATGTAEPGGLSPDQATTIINKVAAEFSVTGADIMEVAPFIAQHGQQNQAEPETTLISAAQISQALLNAM